MNRRDFLRTLLAGAAVTAAGLYLPKTIYSFPAQLVALNTMDLESFNALLKTVYRDALVDLLNTDMPLYKFGTRGAIEVRGWD